MEIKNLNFTRYLDLEEKSIFHLEEFLSKDSVTLIFLLKYDEISYLDDYSKFFFLFKNREKFLEVYGKYVNSYHLHTSSVFYLLFSMPVFSRGLNAFQYELLTEEDSILFIDIFLQIEMFKIVDRIIYNNAKIYNYLNEISTISESKEIFLLNNPQLLLMAPFIFEPLELQEIINKDIRLFETTFDDDSINRFATFSIIESLINLDNDIFEKTSYKYSKIYNSYYYRNKIKYETQKSDEFKNYLSNNYSLFQYDWMNLPKFKVNSEYLICKTKLSFCLNESLEYAIDDEIFSNFHNYAVENNFLKDIIGIDNKNKIYKNKFQNIENQQNESLISTKLKHSLKINIDVRVANQIIEKFIDSKLTGDIKIKNDFNLLFHFINTPEVKEIPEIRNIGLEKVKYLLSFFITMKNETKIFEYDSIEKLVYLLLYVTNNIDSINNTQLRKVHRLKKFKIHKELEKELKSLVPLEFL